MGSNSTRIKIPSGMRRGFGGRKEKKGERACIFHRKRWDEEQAGKSEESLGRKEIVHAHSRGCVVFVISSESES